MRLVELLRRPPKLTESTPVPPQIATPLSIRDSLTRMERLKTANPELRAAIDEAIHALRRALAIADEEYRKGYPRP